MNKLILLFITILLLAGCNKEEIESRTYPRVRTLNVTKVTNEGVKLNAELLSKGNSPIVNYGFLWSRSEYIYSAELASSNHQITSGDLSTGKYSHFVDFSLEEDVDYYGFAFVQTKDRIVYGNSILFHSKGSLLHEIISFSPNEARVGDTITIFGNRFSNGLPFNQVFFNTNIADIVEANKKQIRVIVPYGTSLEGTKISVKCSQKTVSSDDLFTVPALTISNFSPLSANWGDTITLNGDNFSSNKKFNLVYFNNTPGHVLEANKNQIKVLVPEGVNYEEHSIRVLTGNQEKIFNEKFLIQKFQLNPISDLEYTAGDELMIYGHGFNSFNHDAQKVFIGDLQCDIIKAYSNRLLVMVPYELKGGIYDVSVSLFEDTKTLAQNLVLKSPWQRLNDYPGSNTNSGAGFVMGNEYTFIPGTNQQVWSYSSSNDSWIQKNDFPVGIHENPVGVSFNNTGLLGLGNSTNTSYSTMHKYLPETDSWQPISDLPNRMDHNKTVGIGVDNDVYIFEGDYNRHFWKYDSGNDSWHELESIPGTGHRFYSAGFEIDNVIYIIGGLNGYDWNNYRDVWAYDINTGKWSEKNNFPGRARHGAVAFTINGKGYYGTGRSSSGMEKDFYKYDPVTDMWERITDFEGEARYNAINFAINDNAYVGIGDKRYYNHWFKDIWKFTPTN